ncbi:MAG: hypothetical protein GX548_09325 [Lentisphaerae bacterium]|nr:hypothetical protein [Lentisphaerota bacterium]
MDPDTRPHAFHELWNRTHPTNQVDLASFEANHYAPDIMVCPQENGKPSLHLVLYGFLPRERFSTDPCYETPHPEELFDPKGNQPPPRPWDLPAIVVYAADGREIQPFGGDNGLVPPGRIDDINGDGLVERADHSNCHVPGISSVSVLEVVVVAPSPRPLLTVLFNWGADEWTYRFTDADRDDILEIELGPKTRRGMIPKITYSWDPESRVYVGPDGAPGNHFLRLDPVADVYDHFDRLQTEGLSFPPDPDYENPTRMPDCPWERRGMVKPAPEDLSRPYRYASLQDLSSEGILSFMGGGRNARDLEQSIILSNHVPDAFWSLPPKEAAFAFADANRYPIHRDLYALAIDDRDGLSPPDAGSIAVSQIHDKSYSDVDTHYFLRVDPERSCLAYSRPENGSGMFLSLGESQPTFDFRLCELDYPDARHIAHVLWWLDRLRSHRDNPPDNLGSSWSSADGQTSLDFRSADGSLVLHRDGTLWSDHIAERWQQEYTPEVFVNLADHLFYDPLRDRLGEAWSAQAPKRPAAFCRPDGSACLPSTPPDLPPLTPSLLNLFTPDQTHLSLAIARDAVRAAGETADSSLEAPLAALLSQIPDLPPKRTRQDIEAELQPLKDLLPSDPDWTESQPLKNRLHDELMDSYRDTGANDFHSLRSAIELSLRQIRSANDLDTLDAWARTKDPGADWAIRRLRHLDHGRYVETLEWWVHHSESHRARHAFNLLARENSARAGETAAEPSVTTRDDLAAAAFTQLARATDMPDGPPRIEALIRVALSTNSYSEERGRAIDLLAPSDQPLKYPNPEIDETLLRLMDPAMADRIVNWTLGKACLALARRGRTDTFDAMADTLTSLKDPAVYPYVLQALVQLAQLDPPRFHPRLADLLQPQFRHTNQSIPELLMAAWAADLRQLQPDIERIATSGPDDYESERAHSYGGHPSDVDDRFHLARQIASLWNEKDPATKARLLLAFGFHQASNLCVNPRPEQTFRMETELSRLAPTLSPDHHRQVTEFIKWLRSSQINPAYLDRDPRAAFLTRAAAILSPPPP